METKKIKAGREDRIFNITVTVISLVVLVIVLYPLYFVIIASISSPEDISLGKVRFLPSGINFAAYKFVLEEWKIWRGYLNTIFYTFFGTLLGTSVTLMAAFALSRKECDNQAFCIHHVLFRRTDSHLYGGQQPSYGEYENCPGGDGDGYCL